MKKLILLLLVLCFATVLSAAAAGSGTGSLLVTVYRDSNNNGERGTYERPLSGVQITALLQTDAGELLQASLFTNSNGEVRFSGLPAGTYRLQADMPATYAFGKRGTEGKDDSSIMDQSYDATQVSGAISLAAGETKKIGIGAMRLAAVSGAVWMDEDANGIKGKNEPGVSGVFVELYSKADSSIRYEAHTDETGAYGFFQVRPGTYRLRVTTPEGLMFTKYSKSGGKNRSIITTEGKRVGAITVDLEAGDEVDQQYVGLVHEGAVTGLCFLDANYNGFYDEGELPLPGVELELSKQKTSESVATAVSGADGIYRFPALRDGEYKVTALLPKGNDFTTTVDGGNQFKAREGRRSNTVQNIMVKVGQDTEVVVGAVKYGTVSGIAYLDDNFSGTRDGKEQIVSGLVVRLLDERGNILVKDRTNGKGRFEFTDLAPGRYYLTAAAKTGYAFTKPGEGSVMINDSEGEGHSEVFTVELGTSYTNLNLGMIKPGTVTGVFFADENDNGRQDSGEGGLLGTTVRLMSDEGEHFSAVIGQNGIFTFDAVMPGTYWLRYELPENAVTARMTGRSALPSDQAEADGASFKFTVGSTYQAETAGGLTLGAVSGIAFSDDDGDGAMGDGESLLAGMQVELIPSRSDLEPLRILTDEMGAFAFENLRPDTYTLRVTSPERMVLSRTDHLRLPLQPGSREQQAELPIAMGDRYTEQQLGAVVPGRLVGQLWMDENNDGLMDDEEVRPQGFEVTVIDESNGKVFAVLTTDGQGIFRAEGLVPGSYTLSYPLTSEIRPPKTGDSTFVQAGETLQMTGVQIQTDQETDGLTLGVVRFNTISGQVWVDLGREITALAGAKLVLTDASGAQVAAMETGDDGNYAFRGLLPGGYALQVALPEGQLVVEQEDERITSGRLHSVMRVTNGRGGNTGLITISMMGSYTDWDIGSVLPGRIGDKAWLDENGNGLQDSGEKGISGVIVELQRNGRTVAETMTDQYGYWLITDVYPAAYTLRVTPPAEVRPTIQDSRFPMIASVLKETDAESCMSEEVTVLSDQHNYDADLGFVLRRQGVYPAGFGVTDHMDWTRIITVKE